MAKDDKGVRPKAVPRHPYGTMRVYDRPGFDLKGLAADYANRTISRRVICEKYAICESTLNKIAREQRWRWRAPKPTDRHDIIDRLFRLLDTQIEDLENKQVTDSGTPEVTALSRLVMSLGRLIDIKDAEAAKRQPQETREMCDIKERLIERIEQLKRG